MADHTGHFGLLGIRERAEKIGASLSIRSSLGVGSKIQIVLPLAKLVSNSRPPMKKQKIRLQIVDDHFIVRIGLRTSINMFEEMCVVSEASTGAQALALGPPGPSILPQPQVPILDVSGGNEPAGARKKGTQPIRPDPGARDTYGLILRSCLSGSPHAHRVRARRRHPRPPHRPRVRGDGQRQRLVPRRPRARDHGDLHRRPARGRRRRRGRRLPPRRRRARRGDRDLRRRLHQHADRPRRGGAGARAARARRRRRADVGPPPVGRRPDRPRVGRRRAHLHGRTSGCRGHDGHRHRARAHLPRARRCSRSPTTSPRSRRDPCPRRPNRVLPAPLAPRGPFAEHGVADIARALAGAQRPFLLAGRGAWVAGAGDALGALADATGARDRLDRARPRDLPPRRSSTSG